MEFDFDCFPDLVVLNILSYLSLEELLHAREVCQRWCNLIGEKSLWWRREASFDDTKKNNEIAYTCMKIAPVLGSLKISSQTEVECKTVISRILEKNYPKMILKLSLESSTEISEEDLFRVLHAFAAHLTELYLNHDLKVIRKGDDSPKPLHLSEFVQLKVFWNDVAIPVVMEHQKGPELREYGLHASPSDDSFSNLVEKHVVLSQCRNNLIAIVTYWAPVGILGSVRDFLSFFPKLEYLSLGYSVRPYPQLQPQYVAGCSFNIPKGTLSIELLGVYDPGAEKLDEILKNINNSFKLVPINKLMVKTWKGNYESDIFRLLFRRQFLNVKELHLMWICPGKFYDNPSSPLMNCEVGLDECKVWQGNGKLLVSQALSCFPNIKLIIFGGCNNVMDFEIESLSLTDSDVIVECRKGYTVLLTFEWVIPCQNGPPLSLDALDFN